MPNGGSGTGAFAKYEAHGEEDFYSKLSSGTFFKIAVGAPFDISLVVPIHTEVVPISMDCTSLIRIA